MTDQMTDKVAVQTEESRSQSRRAFLKGSAAVAGGVLFTKAALADEKNEFNPKKAVAPYAGMFVNILTVCLLLMKKKFSVVH